MIIEIPNIAISHNAAKDETNRTQRHERAVNGCGTSAMGLLLR